MSENIYNIFKGILETRYKIFINKFIEHANLRIIKLWFYFCIEILMVLFEKNMKKLMLGTFMVYSLGLFSQEIKNEKDIVKNNIDNKVSNEAEAKNKALLEKQALPKPYNPKANAEKDIKDLVEKAQKEGKNILIQAGGNWCIWCLRFNDYVQKTPELKQIVDDNYLYYHLNYSPDNKNEKVFEQYIDVKQQQFYPFFIILDKNGKKIHIQQSEVLEEGKGYSLEKVKTFFNQWLPNKS